MAASPSVAILFLHEVAVNMPIVPYGGIVTQGNDGDGLVFEIAQPAFSIVAEKNRR
jgi:hypothetical protein